MGTDDITQKLPDDQFSQIIAEFRALRSIVDGAVVRLDSLEKKVDARFMNTQPLGETVQEEFQKLHSKVDGLTSRVDGLESKLESRIDGLESKLESRIDGLESKLESRIDGLEYKIDNMHEDIGDKLGVLADAGLEAEAKYKRFRKRLSDLEEKGSNPA
jgi:tetrahydromethanopterin S-methyltransferase subunit G